MCQFLRRLVQAYHKRIADLEEGIARLDALNSRK